MRLAKLTVKLGEAGKWFLQLVARNGEPLDRSEMYDSKGNAMRAKADRYLAYADVLTTAGWICLEPWLCKRCQRVFHEEFPTDPAVTNCAECFEELRSQTADVPPEAGHG